MHVPLTEVILRHGETELARVTLPPGEYVIGRSEEVEIFAETALISRRHAKLVIAPDQLSLEDLGSSNGTFVAEQRISESTRLFPNQHVRLGDVVLEVHRERASTMEGVELHPAQAAIRRLLPDELLAQKRYAIGAQVARGGMGAIMHARQQATQRDVAMKVMLETQDEAGAMRFIDEAQVTARLEHPNIVPVYELGVDEQDQLFYTMKFVRGITLKKVLELIAQGIPETVKKYPLSALLTIFQKACDALAFAHSRGIIHRDLKPENLMLGDFGEVLVMDWGLAKRMKEEGGRMKSSATSAGGEESAAGTPTLVPGRLSFPKPATAHDSGDVSLFERHQPAAATMAGAVMGTPQYMSPEQARGEVETLDRRSDIYALGAILFEIIYLRGPVSGDDPWGVVAKVAQGVVEWDPAASAATGHGAAAPTLAHLPGGRVPDSLMAVCRKALEFDRSRRYAGVSELQLDLTAYQNGFATSAENAGAWKQFRLLIRRNRAVTTAIAGAFVIVAAVTAVFTIHTVRARNRAETTLHELRGTAPTFAAQARALVEDGKLEEGVEKINYATGLDPKNPDYLLTRGNYLQIALHLRDAVDAYRKVLALRPNDAGAQQNLNLCEQLLADNGGKDELPQPLIVKLVDALLAQGRVIEANPLAQRVGKGGATTEAALRARLKDLTSQPGWNNGRLRVLPNGTYALALGGLRIRDLEVLRDFPISSLDLDDPNFADLSPLAGLPLAHLSIANTAVTDLSPLKGMPLDSLYLNHTRVTDLSPLKTMKLKELHIDQLELPNLDAIAGLQLERLDLWGSKITDISALKGMPIRSLQIGNTRIVDFSALAGMPLESLQIPNMDLPALPPLPGLQLHNLNANGNHITDLRPLTGLALNRLEISGNSVSDLTPIRGMPLTYLDVGMDAHGIDLAPLAECKDLEEIILPRYFLHEEILRKLPKMRKARVNGYQNYALPMKQFWTELKPEWINMGHARTIVETSGLKHLPQNPVSLESDGTLRVDLNRTEGSAIPALGGLPISRLTCDSTNFSDLSPLRGLPLRRVSFASSPVRDLGPLEKMPLESLYLNNTKVKDFTVLRAMPLQEIYVSSLGLRDLTFLRGRPLRRLDLGNNPITDISVVAGMPLEWLVVSGTDVADLTPLRGMPLRYLALSHSQVRDLNPLRGMLLTELNADGIPARDLAPLLDLPRLEKLRIEAERPQLALLRQHPTLKYIATGSAGPLQPVAEFWAAFDAAHGKPQ